MRSGSVKRCAAAVGKGGIALELTAQDPFVVITGSLYLVGEAMELLGLSAAPLPDERGLNEWSGTPPPQVRRA